MGSSSASTIPFGPTMTLTAWLVTNPSIDALSSYSPFFSFLIVYFPWWSVMAATVMSMTEKSAPVAVTVAPIIGLLSSRFFTVPWIPGLFRLYFSDTTPMTIAPAITMTRNTFFIFSVSPGRKNCQHHCV